MSGYCHNMASVCRRTVVKYEFAAQVRRKLKGDSKLLITEATYGFYLLC